MVPYLTIITPTFNRGTLLKNCFASLCAQTSKDFEWIIVDDGSQDDTAEVVKNFISPDFPIVFITKENGGKHTALNAAMGYIRGQYVLILDSDDTLVENAVSSIRAHWSQFTDADEVGILTFLRGHDATTPLCTVQNFDTPVDILRYHRNVIITSDCCEVIRTELFCRYPFPVFEGEHFISECALWNRVALTHKCVYINEIIYLCEYLEDGLTKAGRALRIRNPKGGMFTSNLRMTRKNNVKHRVKYAMLYICYGFFAELSVTQILSNDPENRCLKCLCLVPGYALYRIWKKKYT